MINWFRYYKPYRESQYPLEHDQPSRGYTLKENPDFPSSRCSTVHSSSVRSEDSQASPPPLWSADWLDLVCTASHSCCEFTCAAVLLWPEDTVSLQSSLAYGPYNIYTLPFEIALEPWVVGYIQVFLLGLSIQQTLILCTLINVEFLH